MSKHKRLSELAESSHAVNVDISNKMKYYDMLNQESKWGCKWEGGGGEGGRGGGVLIILACSCEVS